MTPPERRNVALGRCGEGKFRERLDRWRRPIWDFNLYNRQRWVAEQARRIPSGMRVLDVGAGIGQYRTVFAHCDYKTQDFGQEPATIGKYTPLDYQSDIGAIPVEDRTFDVIVCTEVLEHVPHPDAALAEMARILKPGGRLLLTAPLASFLHQEPYHYYGGFTPHWYRKFLPDHGFDVESIVANAGFFSLLGQNAQHCLRVLRSPAPNRLSRTTWAALMLMRLVTRPLAQLLPLLGRWLDSLNLERTATAGYHVVAIRRAE
jgi:SAM-dependent methyltransferase